MRNKRLRWVSGIFDDFLTKKSRETGISKIKLTEKFVIDGVVDENVLKDRVNTELWGGFYRPKRK